MDRGVSLVILDLDDTLVSFNGVRDGSWLEACVTHAHLLGGRSSETVAEAIKTVGDGYWDDPARHKAGRLDLLNTRRKIVARALAPLGVDTGASAITIADEYSRIRLDAMYLFEGAISTLETLAERGLKRALLTNGDSEGQRAKIERFGIGGYFDRIYIEEEAGYGKPEIEAFTRVLEDFGVRPEQAVMVGDNYRWEIEPPSALGMRTVWVNPGNHRTVPENSPEPDLQISHIGELIEAIDSLI